MRTAATARTRRSGTGPGRLRVLLLGGHPVGVPLGDPVRVQLTVVSAFVDRMARTDAGRNVIVAIYSEFGRRVRANASDGTDHGTASDVFVLGAPVRGGLYGGQPSLTDLDEGDLKFTTDFRDVYATLLDGVLRTDPGKVLGDWRGRIDRLLT